MTSPLPSRDPLSNPAGRSHRQGNIWKESQPVCTQWRRMQNPTSCLDDSLRFFPSFYPFKNYNGWAESLDLVLGHESTFSPDCQLFWVKHLSFLLTHTSRLLAFEWRAAELEFRWSSSPGSPQGDHVAVHSTAQVWVRPLTLYCAWDIPRSTA